MKNIYLVVKNNLYRLLWERASLLMILLVMPFIIYFGIYFSSHTDLKGKIAVTGADKAEEELFLQAFAGQDKIFLEFMEKDPLNTELIKGLYLAEIKLTGEEPEIISYGNKDIQGALEAALKGEVYEGSGLTVTAQGKIMGFLVMFFFFGGSMAMDFFLTDRESGVYRRTLTANVSYLEYVLGQLFFAILLFTLPCLLEIFLMIKLLKVELTIGLGAFALVILVTGLLSSGFALIVSTFCRSRLTAQMTVSAIAMISSLFGGCLIDVVDSNRFIALIRECIPQKRIIDLANEFQAEDMIFLLVFTAVLILVSVTEGKRQCTKGEFL